MPTYLSAATLRDLVPLMSDVTDAVANLFLNGVEQSLAKFLGYDLAYQTDKVFYLDTFGERSVRLPTRAPVWSVSSVKEDRNGNYGQTASSFGTATALVEGTDYSLVKRTDNTELMGEYTGEIYRINALWPISSSREATRLSSHLWPVRGCVKVVATVGYTDGSPADLITAAYQEAAARWQMRNGLGAVLSQTIDGLNLSMTQPNLNLVDGATGPFLTPSLYATAVRYRITPIA